MRRRRRRLLLIALSLLVLGCDDKEKEKPKKGQPTGEKKHKKRMDQLERDIESMEELVASFDNRFTKVDPSDYVRARELKDEYEALKGDLKALYSEWESLAPQASA